MSGTSVDGLDIAYCSFTGLKTYKIKAANTITYPKKLSSKLKNCLHLSSIDLALLDAELGYFIGHEVNKFLKKFNLIKPFAIASHGHTVFHHPKNNTTVQIGKGSHIAAKTGIKTICDFRSTDIALGGQGAPLVPIGDKNLFGNYDYCLNLGGIANVSFQKNKKRFAFDICPCNLPLNLLMNKIGKNYDKNGLFGKKGKIDANLLQKLNGLNYYGMKTPKSLGREWIEKELMPLLSGNELTNVLRTYYEHIGLQIGKQLKNKNAKVLVTGGGAKNSFLINRIKQFSEAEIVLPETGLMDFKEALIFAYLGYLRTIEKPNALASVTGAKNNSICGAVYLP